MTRTEILLTLLRQHGPGYFGDLRALTGWDEKYLARALEVARGPRGQVVREYEQGQWRYRLATAQERLGRERPRGVKPGATWSRARRAAQERRAQC